MLYSRTLQTITPAAIQRNDTAPYVPANVPAFKNDLFTRFIDYVDRKPSTIKGYVTCIKHFMQWMQDNGIKNPKRDDIKAYRDDLRGSGLAVGTQAQYLRAVKQFFKWTAAENLYPNVADNIHGAKIRHDIHKKDALQQEDVKKIADTIDRTTEQGKRIYAMYLLCVVNGTRCIELHRADVADLKTIGGETYLYLQGKGHDDKDAPVLLIKEVSDAIADYLNSRSCKPTAKSPLFTSTSNRSKGKRIATTTISTMLKQLLVNAGYDSDRLTAHSLRHTSGTGAHKAGVDLYGVQHLMRHADPATSEIYIHDDDTAKEEERGRTAIYDYYFNGKESEPIVPDLERELHGMSEEEQQQLLAIIKEKKGGKE